VEEPGGHVVGIVARAEAASAEGLERLKEEIARELGESGLAVTLA